MLVFTTRNSLDFIFRPFKADDTRNVDVTMVGTVDGQVQISIYDSFIIGKFNYQVPKSPEFTGKMHLCCHASHQDISTHALLFKAQPTESGAVETAVHLVPVDLTFIYSSPINLSLLASKTTMLQNLLRYIKQAQIHMVGEWKSTRELPARFMASVQDDLLKLDKGRDIVQALYHTVVTGHVHTPMKEWLLDSVAERVCDILPSYRPSPPVANFVQGHKRWDKAVTSGLENLRALIHENMMPALQRAAIILSRLRGIARFEAGNNDIGFTAAQVSKLIDITQCLYAVCYKILRLVMKELVLFRKFSIWLRLEIDRLASSTMSDELLERQANVDFPKVLKYIKGHLTSSPMGIFFDDVEEEDRADGQTRADDAASIRELLETQVKRQQTGQSYMKALPQLNFLVDYMTSRSESMLRSIAETQRRRVRFAPPTRLEIDGQVSRYDIQMCAQQKQSGLHGRVFTALATDTCQTEGTADETPRHHGIKVLANETSLL
jgi:anaphase-promoting complex subunit 4